ncbi:MAG: PilN domain-containing protein [Mariprofundus sp.]|nr:PilN domain-containing protein [Mariprofundus sp.]
MIRINLIPYRVAHRQQQIFQHVAIFIGVVIATALLTFAVHAFFSTGLTDLKNETVKIEQQNRTLKKKIGKIKNLDKLRANVVAKLKIVDRLQEGRFHSLKTLHKVSVLIPKNVWVAKIKEQKGDLLLSGFAENNKAVAVFMRRLDQSELFTNVRLDVISRVTINTLPLRRFKLKMTRVDVVASSTKVGH